MKGPWRVLSVQGSLHILHFLWHHPNENSYWLYFFHSMQQKWDQGTLGTQWSNLIGSRTHLGPSMDPAKALQYTLHLTWPFIYWLYFFILCNKNGIKRTLGIQRLTLIGSWARLSPSIDPAIALQYPQHGNLYIGYIFEFYLIPFLLLKMQKYCQYTKGHVRCIVGPSQGPLKDQGRSFTQ